MTFDECEQFVHQFVSIEHEWCEEEIIVYITDFFEPFKGSWIITVLLFEEVDKYLTATLWIQSIKKISSLPARDDIMYKLKYLL